jgi:hypothetical protein
LMVILRVIFAMVLASFLYNSLQIPVLPSAS